MPNEYQAPVVLQFWIFLTFFASLMSKRQRAFLGSGERYAYQFFDTSVYTSGDYENALNF